MKKALFFTIIGAMLAWAIYDFTMSGNESANQQSETASSVTSNESADVGLAVGQTAPDFTLETLDGEQARLSDFRGKTVFVNFWATWCPPCRAEMPDMQKLYDNEDIEILAINLTDTEKSEDGVASFVEEMGLTFPVLMDTEGEISSAYNVKAYPTSYMVDAEGKISYIAYGAMNYNIMVQEYEKMK
ncbi:peroxiredoxin family protein [Planococcus halotolerans]|uniref:peroxiredoxin family protein n=1 Tax=Planococcus halotolerans TaxID=2233542 RepID=UPI0010930937|nr:TlpA disulfide reductase family protein [Planococcus halotolerans]QHJ69880.1 redoxin domain-containing protein [Planococcus halotolerans]